MKTSITLVQRSSSSNKVTFSAKKVINLDGRKTINEASVLIADFCKDTIEYCKRSKERGLNISMIRKTQPIDIIVQTETKDLTISINNFGKWVEANDVTLVTEQLQDTFKFTDTQKIAYYGTRLAELDGVLKPKSNPLLEYVNDELSKLDRGIVATPSEDYLDKFSNSIEGGFLLMQMSKQYGYKLAMEEMKDRLTDES